MNSPAPFYDSAAEGLPLDAVVAGARTSLKAEVGSTPEWGTPVLYMRSPIGRISDVSDLASSVEPLQPSIGA